MKKFSKLIGLIGVLAFTIAGCASGSAKDTKTETVKLGVVGTKNDEWESVKERLKKKNIDLQLVEFTDYTQPNAALAEKEIDLTELDATQTARALQDVDASVINSGMAVDAGYTPDKDAIFLEPVNEKAKPYVNIVVAREEDQENKLYQKVVEEYQQEETKKVIAETSKGANVPAWETFGKK